MKQIEMGSDAGCLLLVDRYTSLFFSPFFTAITVVPSFLECSRRFECVEDVRNYRIEPFEVESFVHSTSSCRDSGSSELLVFSMFFSRRASCGQL